MLSLKLPQAHSEFASLRHVAPYVVVGFTLLRPRKLIKSNLRVTHMFQQHVSYMRFYYYFHFFFFASHQAAAALAFVCVSVCVFVPRSFLFLLISACRLDARAKRVRMRMPQEPHAKHFVAYFFAPLAEIF